MKFLIYDTSGNAIPKNYSKPFTDTINWPRLIHLSWQIIDEQGKQLDTANDIIKLSADVTVSEELLKRHGLEQSDFVSKGVELSSALQRFNSAIENADYVFTHNERYNANIIRAEFFRTNIVDRLYTSEAYCLMQETTHYCKLPGRQGTYKWPTLTELHKSVFNRSYKNPQNAQADMEAISRCFIVLFKTNVLEDIF